MPRVLGLKKRPPPSPVAPLPLSPAPTRLDAQNHVVEKNIARSPDNINYLDSGLSSTKSSTKSVMKTIELGSHQARHYHQLRALSHNRQDF